MYNFDFTPIVRIFQVIFVLCLIFMVYSVYAFFFKKPVVISNKIIVPEKHITVKNDKVDTVYVYKNH